MRKALYIEAFSGISGNMLLGALLDLGADADFIAAELQKMNLGEYELINTRADKCGINAAYFNVKVPGIVEAAELEEHGHCHGGHGGHHCHHHEGEEHHHYDEDGHHCCHHHEHEEGHEHHCCHAHDGAEAVMHHHHHHEHRGFSEIKTIIEQL